MAAPARTRPETVTQLNRAVASILAEPAIRERLQGLGADPMPTSPDALGALIAADVERWGAVVRAANLQP